MSHFDTAFENFHDTIEFSNDLAKDAPEAFATYAKHGYSGKVRGFFYPLDNICAVQEEDGTFTVIFDKDEPDQVLNIPKTIKISNAPEISPQIEEAMFGWSTSYIDDEVFEDAMRFVPCHFVEYLGGDEQDLSKLDPTEFSTFCLSQVYVQDLREVQDLDPGHDFHNDDAPVPGLYFKGYNPHYIRVHNGYHTTYSTDDLENVQGVSISNYSNIETLRLLVFADWKLGKGLISEDDFDKVLASIPSKYYV